MVIGSLVLGHWCAVPIRCIALHYLALDATYRPKLLVGFNFRAGQIRGRPTVETNLGFPGRGRPKGSDELNELDLTRCPLAAVRLSSAAITRQSTLG